MAEYLIKEESLVEIADILREKFADRDVAFGLIFDKNSLSGSFTFPDGITSIQGFYGYQGAQTVCRVGICSGCYNLEEIVIPNSVTTIGDYAFYYNYYVDRIEIPDSVTHIGDYAFSICNGVDHFIIPSSVMYIGRYAFADVNATTISILGNIEKIDYHAFEYCRSLKDFYIYASTPPQLGKGVFYMTSNLTIHVPIGSEDAYKAATNWSGYASKIVGDITLEGEV